MIKIVTKELEFDKELKKKIEFVCDFCNTKPNRIIIKGITLLMSCIMKRYLMKMTLI